jgi:glycosyltransferase A (GT-A) superfamily protein (DUF2064 family)
MTTVAVIAKACLPGRVKTRLSPPLTLEEAALIAAASLADTLDLVRSLPDCRRVLFFDGDPELAPAEAAGFELLPQPSTGGLDVRLGVLFDSYDDTLVLLGMDTPQVRRATLAPIFEDRDPTVDAWYGGAADGGFWTLALRAPTGDLLRGVPMSVPQTGREQLRRLRAAGLRIEMLPTLIDIDTIEDAETVAPMIPQSRLAMTLSAIGVQRVGAA